MTNCTHDILKQLALICVSMREIEARIEKIGELIDNQESMHERKDCKCSNRTT